ncbi:MAG: CBS domain-containing protein [Bdellovibrionales bacterium]
MKRTVSDLMAKQSIGDVPTIGATQSVEQAMRVLHERQVGALLVTSLSEVVGVFSERDFARAAVANNFKLPPSTKVSDLMTKKVIYVTSDYRLDECLSIMAKMKVRHLPVMDGNTPIALLSMRQIMTALIEENQFMVEQLVIYITGSQHEEKRPNRSGLIRDRREGLERMMY